MEWINPKRFFKESDLYWFCPLISAVFLFSIAAFSCPVIVYDSIGYENLGKLFASGDWMTYFTTGPNREPLYPLFIALAMKIASLLRVPYTAVALLLQAMVLLSAQLILMGILRTVKVSGFIIALICFYFVVSPHVLTSSTVIFSEILFYPLILIFIYLLHRSLSLIIDQASMSLKEIALQALGLSIPAVLLTSLKGIFEILVPVILVLIWPLAAKNKKRYFIFLVLTTVIFWAVITPFKCLNKIYNDNFTLTDRGPVLIYGNIVRNSSGMNGPKFLSAALTVIPDKEFCNAAFSAEACSYWDSMASDKFGIDQYAQLRRSLSPDETNKRLISLSVERFWHYPVESIGMCLVQASRFFFWEIFPPAFVALPSWVVRLYSSPFLFYSLLFLIPVISVISFVAAIRAAFFKTIGQAGKRQRFTAIIIIVMSVFIAVHSLLITNERYALQMVPLFLILIAFFLDRPGRGRPLILNID